jgi:hypothetical protein
MTRTLLRQMLSERRAFKPGSLDWQWRTEAAREYVWLIMGKPVDEWPT